MIAAIMDRAAAAMKRPRIARGIPPICVAMRSWVSDGPGSMVRGEWSVHRSDA